MSDLKKCSSWRRLWNCKTIRLSDFVAMGSYTDCGKGKLSAGQNADPALLEHLDQSTYDATLIVEEHHVRPFERNTTSYPTQPTKRPWWAGLFAPSIILFGTLLFTSTFYTLRPQAREPQGFSCLADGTPLSAWQGTGPLNLWNRKLYLSITLSFGDFSFAQAKAIDVAWDLVVGRGGQLASSLLVYSGMRRYIFLLMEKEGVEIRWTTDLTFANLSLWSFWIVAKEIAIICRRLKRPSNSLGCRTLRAQVAFLVLLAYVLGFSTWTSAMTGYQPVLEPFYSDPQSDTILRLPTSDSGRAQAPTIYIDQGQRIGLSRFAWACQGLNTSFELFKNYYQLNTDMIGKYKEFSCSIGHTNLQTYCWNSSIGHFWLDPSPPLESPVASEITLNDTTYSLPPYSLYVNRMDGGEWNQWENQKCCYNISGKILMPDWIEENTICQPGKTYRWGFSALMLFTFSVLTIVASGVLLALEVEIVLLSQSDRIEKKFVMYRDILRFADAIQASVAGDPEQLSDQQLQAVVDARHYQMRLDTDNLPRSRRDAWRRRGFKQVEPFEST